MRGPDGGKISSVTAAARLVLLEPDPELKARLTLRFARDFGQARLVIGDSAPPERPARPHNPPLVSPRQLPKRSAASLRGRIALLHALAHIELNAIDLAWDLIGRFRNENTPMPRAFYADWVKVAAEEAKHFRLLSRRLNELGATYGDLPAHDGLWRAAHSTRHDLLARLAVVPLVLEARGLDVTPGIIAQLAGAGDRRSAQILTIIAREEVRHVRAGHVWFEHVAAARSVVPETVFKTILAQNYGAIPRPPFNVAARSEAGLPARYYQP